MKILSAYQADSGAWYTLIEFDDGTQGEIKWRSKFDEAGILALARDVAAKRPLPSTSIETPKNADDAAVLAERGVAALKAAWPQLTKVQQDMATKALPVVQQQAMK